MASDNEGMSGCPRLQWLTRAIHSTGALMLSFRTSLASFRIRVPKFILRSRVLTLGSAASHGIDSIDSTSDQRQAIPYKFWQCRRRPLGTESPVARALREALAEITYIDPTDVDAATRMQRIAYKALEARDEQAPSR